jgi:putative ABC transport system permease protein
MPPQLFPATADALAVQNRIHDGLEKIPGVTGVSAVDALPLTANPNSTTIAIPGAPGNTGEAERDGPLVDYIGTRAGYIDVMGIRVVVGRGFDRGRRDNVREALIDRRLANHFFPVGNPLGAKIAFRDGSLTVIGVVEQARLYNVHQDGRPQLFLRAEDWAYRDLSFVLRAGHDPLALVPDVRTVLRRIDPRLALGDVRTMDDIVSDALRQQRISAVLIAGFALGALLLAAMGLFSAVAQSVTRRRFELAMRLALGANAHGILRLVVTDGTRLVGLGLIVGVPGIYLAGRLLRGLLVGVSPFDPLTLLAVASGTGLVGTVACYLPARRVLKIEPAQLLRQE